MKKRLLSLCMALFFLLALVPGLPAYSAIVSEGPPEFFPEEWGPLTYQIVNIPVSGGYKQEVYILKSNKKTTGDLTIPSALDGYAVTRIEESAFSGSKFSSISVPDTVTKIEDKAFMSCPNLTSVSIAGNGTKLGTSLFSGCAKLVDVILPGGITEIPVNTFYGCSSLPDITIPSGVTVIRDSAFQGCSSLAGITIPGSVTGIEPNAFRDCTSLTYASIPSSVTSIGTCAFEGCTSLKEVTVPGSVTTVGQYLFENCTGLTNATLGNGVPEITGYMFHNCTGLVDVSIPNSVTLIDNSAFNNCTSLKNLTIPASVTGMGYIAFENCSSLTNLVIGNGDGIGEQPFVGCGNLTNVVIGEGSNTIAGKAFQYNAAPVFITIPASVTSIGYRAFYCTTKTTHVFFGGTEEQWNAIVDEGGNGTLFGATVHYNCTEAPSQYLQKSEVLLPTCTEAGYTTYGCTICGYSHQGENIAALGHSYVKGICTGCGEEDPDYVAQPVLKLSHPSLTFEDVITMNVYFSAEDLEDTVEMGLITYSSQVADYNVGNAEAVIPGYAYNASTGLYSVVSNGIAAKDMGDTMWFAIYAKLTDGSYVYTKLVSYSPKTYAYSMLTKGTEATRKLCVALLNYGAAAQTYFSYNTGSLMNSDLTADQIASIESYRSDMMTASVAPDAAKAANFVNNGGYTKRYPSIVFEGAFSISYNFIPSAAPVGDITMYVWDQVAYDAAEVLTRGNAAKAIAMTPGDTYTAVVDGIAAKDLDKGIYVTFCYSDGTTEYCSGILNYSIGDYCTGKAADTTTMAPLAAATAVYGYYAKQMFY